MNQTVDNKKNDDFENPDISDEIMCNCNLCWTVRQIILVLPDNIYFRNPFTLFIIIFGLPIFIITIILRLIIMYVGK